MIKEAEHLANLGTEKIANQPIRSVEEFVNDQKKFVEHKTEKIKKFSN